MFLRLELLPDLYLLSPSFSLWVCVMLGEGQGDTTGLHSLPSSCYATFLTHAREPLVLVPLCMQSPLPTPILRLHLSLSC